MEKIISQARMMSQSSETGSGSFDSSHSGSPLSPEQIEELKAFYGFDKPILVSYINWLAKILVLDLGTSTRYYDPVWEIIKSKLPVSAY